MINSWAMPVPLTRSYQRVARTIPQRAPAATLPTPWVGNRPPAHASPYQGHRTNHGVARTEGSDAPLDSQVDCAASRTVTDRGQVFEACQRSSTVELGRIAPAALVVRIFGIVWAIVGLAVMMSVFPPPLLERLTAFGWQLVTPHLLRSGMYQARIQNRNGRRPVIVRVTCEPFGERVRLRCPAGISAEDFHDARGVLRAACWAADVRVTRDKQRSHIVTVDVIRRRDTIGPGNGR